MTRTGKKHSRRIWILGLVAAFTALPVIGLVSTGPYGTSLNRLIRGLALLGYLAVFAAIVSSAYLRQIYRAFGRPFVKVHHIVSVGGLVLITLHPAAVAIQNASARVLVPTFASLDGFLRWGGSPAWILIGIASLTALLRTSIGKRWRLIHVLNYVAFALATVHALLIGTDTQRPGLRVVVLLLAAIAGATFVQKRLARRKQRR